MDLTQFSFPPLYYTSLYGHMLIQVKKLHCLDIDPFLKCLFWVHLILKHLPGKCNGTDKATLVVQKRNQRLLLRL